MRRPSASASLPAARARTHCFGERRALTMRDPHRAVPGWVSAAGWRWDLAADVARGAGRRARTHGALKHEPLLLLQLEDALLDRPADHKARDMDRLVLAQAVDAVLRLRLYRRVPAPPPQSRLGIGLQNTRKYGNPRCDDDAGDTDRPCAGPGDPALVSPPPCSCAHNGGSRWIVTLCM